MRIALMHDLRDAVRHALRSPLFSVTVVVTVALAMSANMTLFSVVNALMLRRLPVADPMQLVAISRVNSDNQLRSISLSVLRYFAARDRVFDSASGYTPGPVMTIEVNGALSAGTTELVTGHYFKVLDTEALIGRLISTDDAPLVGDAQPVAVVGYLFWKRRLGGDPTIVGSSIRVEGVPVTIIGVTRPDFTGLQVDIASDVTLPIGLLDRILGRPPNKARTPQFRYLIARIYPDNTLDAVRERVRTLWPLIGRATALSDASPAEQKEFLSSRMLVEPIGTGFSALRRRYSEALIIVLILSTGLLVLSCINLGGLLLERILSEQRDTAVRLALGASRLRLVGRLLIENTLLCVLGSIVALPVMWWSGGVLRRLFSTGFLPITLKLTPDWRVLTVAGAASVVTGAAIALVPIVATRKDQPASFLQSGRHSSQTSRIGLLLVVSQIALSLVLVFCGVLLTRSAARLYAVDPGFRASGLLLARLSPQPGATRRIDARLYYPELIERIGQLPGVRSVALSQLFPTVTDEASLLRPVAPVGAKETRSVQAVIDVISPRFFHTAGIALLQGRDVSWTDDRDHGDVAVVNTAFASRLFGTTAALGSRISVGLDVQHRPIEVVGIVKDTAIGNVRALHVPIMFRPALQEPVYAQRAALLVSAGRQAGALPDLLRRTVRSLGRDYVLDVRTVEQQIDAPLTRERVASALSLVFAVLGLVMSAAGMFGLFTDRVTRRRREIAIRMALGASRSSILRTILGDSFLITAAGTLLGIVGILWASRFLRSFLFNLASTDPLTLVIACGILVITGIGSSLWPALRAASTEPMAVLRLE